MAMQEKLPDVSLSTDAPVTPGEMIRATLHSPTIFLWVVLMMFTASTEFAPGQWVDVALSPDRRHARHPAAGLCQRA